MSQELAVKLTVVTLAVLIFAVLDSWELRQAERILVAQTRHL